MKNSKKDHFILAPVPLSPAGIGMLPLAPIITDPNGSYTGRPLDQDETPVQDADDL